MRKIYKGFKIRIYPTKEQEDLLFEYCKITHNMWNLLVEKFQNNPPIINRFGIKDYSSSQLMKDYGVITQQRIVFGVIKNFCFAWQRVYKKVENSKPPKFHKYNPNKQSFYVASSYLIVKNYKIMLPVMKGKKFISRFIDLDKNFIDFFNIYKIKEPRFTYYKEKWYLSGSYEIDNIKKDLSKSILGLDWGLKNFMTTSESELINYPPSVLREYQRIKRLQSIKDKKKKGSKNREKIKYKLSKAWERFENLKRDFIEKETTKLAKQYHVILENLYKIEKSKRYLYRYCYISPRYYFTSKLQWKCEKFGSYYIEVDPKYTSQTCSKCGQVHNLSLSDRTMECDCGLVLDRDINAAINIKNRGVEKLHEMGVCCIQ